MGLRLGLLGPSPSKWARSLTKEEAECWRLSLQTRRFGSIKHQEFLDWMWLGNHHGLPDHWTFDDDTGDSWRPVDAKARNLIQERLSGRTDYVDPPERDRFLPPGVKF